MTFGKQLVAIAGISFFCGAMFPAGEALAFGQQWRPAPGFGPAQTGSYRRIANTPSFRPHGAARPTINRSFDRLQRTYRQRPYQSRPSREQFFAAQQYPVYHGAVPVGGGFYPQQPRVMAAGYPAPGWSSPFAQMAQPWGFQMPMFTRQFAWRPAEQPWLARSPVPRRTQPQYRVRAVPQTVGFRPAGPGVTPMPGRWRPAVQPTRAVPPQYAYQRYTAPPVVTSARSQPIFRTAPHNGYPLPGARMAGLDRAPVRVTPGYWRPQAGVPAAAWLSDGRFRPQTYGQRVAENSDAASSTGGNHFTRDNLPGWVTTYQDSGQEGSCSWCSGS